jgi:hypothetical protein
MPVAMQSDVARRLRDLLRLLPKGRKRDDQRLEYDVSAARTHLQEITRLLKAALDGEIPVVAYDRFHSMAEHLEPERYLFQWKGGICERPWSTV